MKASTGDRIMILRRDEQGPVRDGQIVEVPNADGSPPYYVRWSDSGHLSLIFPGPDAVQPEAAVVRFLIASWGV